ncbi:CopG family transcriptional regulator [Halorubrum depositum]|uniref:CopG family transcriptional regulator n=1 Tax=Halorubrum depositum TaxID=2583992 RepID=UPI0011A3E30F|nr:CopG family transcriptional regulator [Halorubrum depositum]
MSTEADSRTVTIEGHLYERVERRIANTNFESVDEYVTFVLEEVLASDEADAAYEDVDDDDVQARLRSLGYLDA